MNDRNAYRQTPPPYNPGSNNRCNGDDAHNREPFQQPRADFRRQQQQQQWQQWQAEWEQQPWRRPTNGLGVAGFTVSLISLFICWIPVIGWLMVLIGLGLSIAGLFRNPRSLAIAGVIISGVVIPTLITVMLVVFESVAVFGERFLNY